MSRLVPLLVVLPLVGAAVALLVRSSRPAQRAISITVLTATLGLSVAVLVDVDRNGPLVAHLGGWPGTFGISYVVDRLGGLMLVISSITMLAVLVFAIGERPRHRVPDLPSGLPGARRRRLAAGFSTGDLFHLFVSFEIMLMASYVLLTLDGDEGQVRAGTTYVVINTIESVVLLVAVGLVYAATGTLSMAELPSRLARARPAACATGCRLLLLVAFGLKAAVFPLFFWLPDSYPTAPQPGDGGVRRPAHQDRRVRHAANLRPCCSRAPTAPCSLWVAGLTMVVGVLGAIAQNDMKRILSFHIVSQIGYMVFGIAIGGPAGIAATIFFLLHQIPIKTSLFLVDGLIEYSTGTSRLDRLSGLLHRSGVLAALFALPALSLAGIPPFSGFVAKLGLVTAGFDGGQRVLVVVGARVQPAHAGVDGEDLALGLLG